MSERLGLGIDFGTSNSSIGSVRNGNIEIFKLDTGKESQPSSVFIRADGYHSTGYASLKDFSDSDSKTDTFHFIPSIKPGLPLNYYEGVSLRSTKRNTEGKLPVRFFGVEEIASYLISNLKSKAEEQTGCSSDSVVLGRPVRFSEKEDDDKLAQNRLEEAAKLAGFHSVRFVMEPIAAALYYEKTRKNSSSRNVFIFDFGGGTLDTCILELGKTQELTLNSLKSKVLSSYGISLGGNDLDKDLLSKRYMNFFGQRVLWGDKKLTMPVHIFNEIPEWHLIDQLRKSEMFGFLREVAGNCTDQAAIERLTTLIRDQQVFAVLQSIEKGKINLSNTDSARIVYDYKDIHLNDLVSVGDYESMIGTRTTEIQDCIDETLERAQLKGSQIDAVLKVGGSSNNRFIDKILARNFQAKIEDDNVFTSVVAGLSIAASEL